MSRVGLKPISVTPSVHVEITAREVIVEGPKGRREINLPIDITATFSEGEIRVKRAKDDIITRSNHGLFRALIASALVGVTEGYVKKLEVNGVGFKVSLRDQELHLALGYSHEIIFSIPEGVSAAIDTNIITLSGINSQLVGRTAAEIRKLRPPEPYKGKGIKYLDEVITHKTGKSAVGETSS